MTRFLTGAFAAALLGAAVIAAAQNPPARGNNPARGNPTPAVNPNPYDPSKTDTVVGCLIAGDLPLTFFVADATVTKGAAPGAKPASPSGTSGVKGKYLVRGVIPPGVNLPKHLNHMVEVVGTIGTPEGKTDVVNIYMFKEVAATCK